MNAMKGLEVIEERLYHSKIAQCTAQDGQKHHRDDDADEATCDFLEKEEANRHNDDDG